jgi:hypothetical protein
MPTRLAALCAAFALALICTPVQAQQWRSVNHTPQAPELPAKAALINASDGHGLRVFLDAESRILARFELPAGLRLLDPAGCPTLVVDEFEIQALHVPEGRCRVDDASATIELARVEDGAVDSPLVLQLLNGEELEIRYRLRHAGYDSVRFTLKRSKSVLLATLPGGTVIVGD